MTAIEISEYILMSCGILFYAICLVFFFVGKANNAGDKTTIGIGNFSFSSNTFIILAITSAIFAFAPLIYSWLMVTQAPPPKLVEQVKEITYQVRGVAEDIKTDRPLKNVTIYAKHLRNDSVKSAKTYLTEQQGDYKFTFDNVRLNDDIEIKWEDPTGNSIRRTFSPQKADFNIPFSNLHND